MSKIYIADDSFSCYVVQNEDTIRAYKTIPELDREIEYRDFYIHSDYMFRDGSQTFSRYGQLPVCLPNENITTDFWYRVDMPDILLMFLIFCIFVFLIPWKIFCRFFRRLN